MPYGSNVNQPGTPAPQYNTPGLAGLGAGAPMYGSGAQAASDQRGQAMQQAGQAVLADPWGAAGGNGTVQAAGNAYQNYTNPRPEFGGYAGGANDAANRYAALANQNVGLHAPAADLRDAYWDQNQARSALALQQAAAMGQTPSAADIGFQHNLDASIAAQGAMANSARGGGAALAAAQRGAMVQGAQMSAQGAQQAAQLRAAEMAQARGQYGSMALGMQGQDAQIAQAAADRQLQQNALNNQMQLGMYGLANQAELGQLSADTGAYGANINQQIAQEQGQSQLSNALISGGAGMMTGGLGAYATLAGRR